MPWSRRPATIASPPVMTAEFIFCCVRPCMFWNPDHPMPSKSAAAKQPKRPGLELACRFVARLGKIKTVESSSAPGLTSDCGGRMRKMYPDAKAALAGVLRNDMTIMAGGFGLCGIPDLLIEAVRESGVKGLTVISNNAGIDGVGLGRLLDTRQTKRMISSYVGENKTFAQQFLAGELEIEFTPQGTLAERIRAGGAGIPAFFTKTGVGTLIAEGKEVREFDGEKYVMERGLFADVALVHAWKGDTEGNLVYRRTARNFNPPMASAAKITVAEVEHLLPAGQIDPDQIHTPGIFVKRIIQVGTGLKRIEQRTTRKRETAAATGEEV